MDGGNRYAAAALHFADEEVRVIIREIYQEPSQSETPSFPPQKPDGFRPYVRSRSLIYYELEEPAIEAIEEPSNERDEQPDLANDDEKETQRSPTPKRGSFEASLDDEDESD